MTAGAPPALPRYLGQWPLPTRKRAPRGLGLDRPTRLVLVLSERVELGQRHARIQAEASGAVSRTSLMRCPPDQKRTLLCAAARRLSHGSLLARAAARGRQLRASRPRRDERLVDGPVDDHLGHLAVVDGDELAVVPASSCACSTRPDSPDQLGGSRSMMRSTRLAGSASSRTRRPRPRRPHPATRRRRRRFQGSGRRAAAGARPRGRARRPCGDAGPTAHRSGPGASTPAFRLRRPRGRCCRLRARPRARSAP